MGLRMADGQNDGRGVPSKDHARDGYVSHTAKGNRKNRTKAMAEEIGTGNSRESHLPILLWIVPWEQRACGYKSPMILLGGTPWQRLLHCIPLLKCQVDKRGQHYIMNSMPIH